MTGIDDMDVFGRNPVDLLSLMAHEIDAATRDDEGLEAACLKVGDQFQHRLINHLRMEPPSHRMLGGHYLIADKFLKLLGGHA